MLVIFAHFFAFAPANTALSCNQTLLVEATLPSISIQSTVDGVLVLEENGGELEYWNGIRWVELSMPTIRLGTRLIRTNANTVTKVRPIRSSSAPMRATVNCNVGVEKNWFFEAQEISEINNTGATSDFEVDRVTKLAQSSPSQLTQAYGKHLQAVTLYSANRTEIAEITFLQAAEKWRALNKPTFQGAAFLSAAHLADRRGDFTKAKLFSDQALQLFSGVEQHYFELRAQEFSCRRMNVSADFDEQINCLSRLRSEYWRIDEKAEALSLGIDISQALRALGKSPSVAVMLPEVESLPNDPNLALIRGRYFLLAADSAIDTGLLAEALRNFGKAFDEFSQATKDAERWQVNTLIRESRLLQLLGLHQQAFANLAHALKIVSAKVAASRVAAILVALAGTYQSIDGADQAEFWYARAEEIQRLLALKLDYPQTAFFRIDNAMGERKPDALLQELNLLPDLPTKWAHRKKILMARLQLAVGAKSEAINSLNSILPSTVAMSDRAYLVIARAEAAEFQSPKQYAAEILKENLADLSQTADQSPTSALAYLTLRSGEKVKRAWIDTLNPQTDPAAVFRTAMLSNPARFMTSVRSAQKRVDTAPKQAEGEQGFLAQLTGPQEKPPERFKASNVPSLAAFQTRLPPGGLALVLLPGDRQSAALWIGRDFTKLALLAARATLQAAAVELGALLASPQSAPVAVDQAADKLSAMLFKDAPEALPASLWIVADELSAAIPFSSLSWPGQTEPLVASTDLSLLTGLLVDPSFSNPANQRADSATTLPSFFAPNYQALVGAHTGTAPRFSNLDFAKVEHAHIERESRRTWPALTGKQATRSVFQDLIQTPGTWLHVAAHGKANPGVLGNAGLWLASAEGPDADFLSWLELGNMRTQAELLVLNACQSATGAQPSRQANISFALAMSASGANHVVAALWPVSDVASGTWIPAFYKQLTLGQAAGDLGGAHSAAALRQAQLSLYQSPHYRHPFYWASLVHFRRVVF